MEASTKIISTGEKITFLQEKTNYPEMENKKDVTVVETHMSWVFLTEINVYKMKKQVKYPFLDFSTLELRKFDCEEEVRLNRRLARDVYQGVIPLTMKNKLELNGEGEAIEWLVRMKRLPEKMVLENKIRNKELNEQEVQLIGKALSTFYKKQKKEQISPDTYLNRLQSDIDKNLIELRHSAFHISQNQLEDLSDFLSNFIVKKSPYIKGRAEKIIEAHGDLRPQHVYVNQKPLFIDYLEFNRRLRLLDPLEELSFLSLECEALGAGWIGELIIKEYMINTNDIFEDNLVRFYKCMRAILRSLICYRHILEPDYEKNKKKWISKGRNYLEMARDYILSIENHPQ